MFVEYAFKEKVWMYGGQASWYFISVPKKYTKEIKLIGQSAHFGSVRVKAQIGEISWQTSIFYDNKTGRYLLPVKKEIRQKSGLIDGSKANCLLVL